MSLIAGAVGVATTLTDGVSGSPNFSGVPDFLAGLKISSFTTLSYFRAGTTVTTFTFNGSGGTSSSVTLSYLRINNFVLMYVPAASATTGTGSTQFQANTAVETWARPSSTATTVGILGVRQQTGAPQQYAGVISISTGGSPVIFRDFTLTAWGNSLSGAGIGDGFTFIYNID